MTPTSLNFRFSAQSRRAKACGVELLNISRGYEDLQVAPGLGVGQLAVLGLVARARHLLRTVHTAADLGDALGATLATRAITESLLTLAWLNHDPEIGESVWMLDEIRTRLSHHKEVADEERRQRRRARRRGEYVEPVEAGKSLGLLTRSMVRYLRKVEREQKRRAENFRNREKRLKAMRVRRLNRMPSFGDRAGVAGMPWAYSLAYRFDSNAAAHPSPLAIERFLDARDDGIHIRATPRGDAPDPYYVSARVFAALLQIAGTRVDQTALESQLAEVVEQLDQMSAELQAQ